MFDFPMTKEEAQAYRYRRWAGQPKGSDYQPTRCAMEVPDGGRSVLFHQCQRPNGHGPDGLYCKGHARTVQARIERRRS